MGLWADHLVATKQSPLLKACKIRSGIIISGRDRIDLVALAVLNTTIVTALAACPIVEWVWIWLVPDRPIESETDVWMAIWTNEAFIKLPIHALVAEAAFYVVHGLLHYSSFLYQTIHRVHHRFPAPTAMACVYAHPLEFVVGNVFPVFLGPILTNAHPATCYLWFALAMLGTCKGHCGYRLFGVCDPHEDHHRWYRYNYGAMGLLDPLLGTTPPRQQHTKSSPQPPP
jgi:sterol desaturase/sphingolipid hydroxylase (fatty acid hydroxylase superfamily)